MNEKIKASLLAIFCILLIVASFVGMEFIRSIYSQDTIELGDISFKTPRSYSYVEGSYNVYKEYDNQTSYGLIALKNQDKRTIYFMQYNETLELNGTEFLNMNGISIYKDIRESVSPYYFNFNGKGYGIITPFGQDDYLVEEILNSMKVVQ